MFCCVDMWYTLCMQHIIPLNKRFLILWYVMYGIWAGVCLVFISLFDTFRERVPFTNIYSSAKVMAVFFFFWFWKLSNWRNIFNFGDNIVEKEYNIFLKQNWCKMFNRMCTAFQVWHNLIFQNQVCFQRLIRFSKISCIFVKICTPRNWHPYSISAMCYSNRTSICETVAHKFRPSVAFDWHYFLQRAAMRGTEPQRWRVVGTSVAGM